MTDSTEPAAEPAVVAGQASYERHDRPDGLIQVAAWVVIIAGTVFVIAVIFFSGILLGWSSSGHYGWHRDGWTDGQMHPGGTTGRCPMMGSDGMMRPGEMGPSGPMGPSVLPTTTGPGTPHP